jgi:hypothetical protein
MNHECIQDYGIAIDCLPHWWEMSVSVGDKQVTDANMLQHYFNASVACTDHIQGISHIPLVGLYLLTLWLFVKTVLCVITEVTKNVKILLTFFLTFCIQFLGYHKTNASNRTSIKFIVLLQRFYYAIIEGLSM